MAIDGSQRARIRKYLGYSSRYLQSSGCEQRLDSAIDAIQDLPDDEAELLRELGQCEWVDEQLKKVAVTVLAIQTGSIHTRAAYQLQTMRNLGTQHAARIANFLGMPLRNGGGFATTGPMT